MMNEYRFTNSLQTAITFLPILLFAYFVNLFSKTHVFFSDTFLEPNKVLFEPEGGEVELQALGEPLHVGDDAELGGDQTEA